MQHDSGHTWTVGSIANGHVLVKDAGWIRLNAQANPAGPWSPGDVVRGHVYTGDTWVALPGGWRPDPTARHHFRWWTGQSWTHHTLTNGLRFDDPVTLAVRPAPIYPPALAQTHLGFWDFLLKVSVGIYCGIWFVIAVYSAASAVQEDEPRYLFLTATASANIFVYRLTGKTRRELKKNFRRAVKPKLPYLFCGALAAGGIWLSLHFDEPWLLNLTVIVVAIGLMFAWVLS